jgi:putative hydrolase of the HAD superfamily
VTQERFTTTLANSKLLDRTPLVILDGDETRWDTQPLYDQAKRFFVDFLADRGVNHPSPIKLLDEVDSDAVSRLGFRKIRFPLAMTETYLRLCDEQDLNVEPADVSAVFTIAQCVFESLPAVFVDTLQVLERLRQSFRLVLLSAGEPDVQHKKIEAWSMAKYFRHVSIVPVKSSSEFESILTRELCRPSDAWSIGNSIRSDIEPALQLGMNAILVNRPTWLYESAEAPSQDFFTTHDLTGAMELLISHVAGRR